MLQTRSGKRTAKAALRIAVELANEGLDHAARKRWRASILPRSTSSCIRPSIPAAERKVIATGLPASPGAASGEIVFSADDAEALKAQGKRVILVRVETSPEDIHGMHAAEGILTTRGGMTSHAAVVARGMGKPCVSGAGMLRVDYAAATMSVAGQTLEQGDVITIDGSTGQVLSGRVRDDRAGAVGRVRDLDGLGGSRSASSAFAPMPTPRPMRGWRSKFGAEGIGLCRTEHMFFDEDRIRAMREMILADDEKSRRAALAKLLPMQRADFAELFEIMQGLPVTIRLLDPPLHEFLPHGDDEIAEVAAAMGADPRKLADRARELHEFNPMLGFRGCRLALAYPEIAEMQARAIFEAAVEAGKRTGKPVVPEVMVPLIATKIELDLVKARIDAMAEAVARETETQGRLSGRHHDRAAARLAARRRDRRERRVLLVRHQRPHPDHLRHQPRRRRKLPRHLHGARHSGDAIRSSRSTAKASASSCASASSAAARRGRSSRSASAASTAAIRPRSRSATSSGSTTCRARRSACRSRGSPPRRPRSASRQRIASSEYDE